MVARMHLDPFGFETCRRIHVGFQIDVGCVADEGRDFRDIDGGQRVQAEMDAVRRALLADRGAARFVEAFQCIRRQVDPAVDIGDVVVERPLHRVLDRQAFTDIDANAVVDMQIEFLVSLTGDDERKANRTIGNDPALLCLRA